MEDERTDGHQRLLDTSVLVAGSIDFGPQSAASQAVMHAVAERTISVGRDGLALCLEFRSVATRLPPGSGCSRGRDAAPP